MTSGGIAMRDAESLAIDIGGTKVDVAVVTPAGELRDRQRIVVADHPNDLAQALCELARDVAVRNGTERTGVACAGPMMRKGESVSPLNIPQWRNFPLREALQQALGPKVAIDGDVRALALAEKEFGAARQVNSFFSMVLSTGIGGAVVIDGRLIDGATGNAGHLGHVNVVPNGQDCSCGAKGCLEAEVSGWAIARQTKKPASEADEATRHRVAELFGQGVGTLASVLDIDRCFVGGSMALGFGDEFFTVATHRAREMATMAYSTDLQILPTGLGNDGPLLGASLLSWRDNE